MTRVSRAVIACALVTAGAAPAWAPAWADDAAAADDDAGNSPIVVTATRTPIEAADAPATVSVITDEDIADHLVTDIHDLVRYEPGVTVRRQPARFNAALSATGRAGNEGFTIRGMGGNRVLIQVDGVRIPYGFSFGAQDVGRGDYVDVGLVKSVEILRGPASALYGSDGLAGAVSFRTADPEDFLTGSNRVGGLVRAAYSSADNEFAETAILAARSGDLSAMVAYTRRDWNELDNRGTNPGTVTTTGTSGLVPGTGPARTEPNPQNGWSNAALGRLVWDNGSGHRIRLTGEYLDTHLFTDGRVGMTATRNALGAITSSVDLLQATDTGDRWRGALDWTWQGEGAIDYARLAVYVQNATDEQYTREDRTPAADRTRRNSFDNRVWGVSGEARSEFSTGALAHRIVFGGEASFTRQKGVRDGTVPPAGETFPTRAFPVTDYAQAGLFVGDEIAFGPVTLFPALRYDHFTLDPQRDPLLPNFSSKKLSDGHLTPKLGIVVRLSDSVRLFGNYGQGYKAPEPSQVNQFFENLAFGYRSEPNPDLGPERSIGWEGGIRFTSDAVSLSVTGFSMKYRDFISQEVVSGSFTPSDPAVYQYVNLSRAAVDGAEARLQLSAHNGLTANLSLSYATGNSTNAAGVTSPLSSIDPLRLVAGVGYRAPSGRFGGELIVTHSAQKEADRAVAVCGSTSVCYRPDGFTLLDATAWVRIVDGLTLRAGIFNITNEKYSWWADVRGLTLTSLGGGAYGAPATADAYTQPGRNASVSLSFRF